MNKQDLNQPKEKYSALSVGLFWAHQIIGAALQVVIMVFVGYWFDRYFNTNPWGVLAFTVIGMVSMLYSFLKIAQDFNKDSNFTDRENDKLK